MASYTNISGKEVDLLIEDREVFMRNFATIFKNNMALNDELTDMVTRLNRCKSFLSNAACIIASDSCNRLSKDTREQLLELLQRANDA